MNRILLVALILFSLTHPLIGQDFSPLENNSNQRKFSNSIIEIAPDEYIYYYSVANSFNLLPIATFPSQFDSVYFNWLKSTPDSAIAYLVRMNKGSSNKKVIPIKVNADTNYFSDFYFNGIYNFDGEITFHLTKHRMPSHFYTSLPSPLNLFKKLSGEIRVYDINLTHLRTITLQDTVINGKVFFAFTGNLYKNLAGNYIAVPQFGDTLTGQDRNYVVEYSGQSGKIIRIDSFDMYRMSSVFIQTPDGAYIGTGGGDFYRCNQNFQLQITKPNLILPYQFGGTFLSSQFYPNKKICKYANKHYIGGFYAVDSSSGTGNEAYYTCLVSFDDITKASSSGLDTVFKQKITYQDARPVDWLKNDNLYDSKYPDYHFIGVKLQSCNIYGSPTCDTTHIQVTCTDTSGTHKWTKILEGLNGYKLTGVTATADSGCIVLALHNADSLYTAGSQSLDVYYCKLDRFGNVEPNFLPTEYGFHQLPVVNKLILYPNPTYDLLYLKTKSIEEFKIFNVLGNKVLEGKYEGRIYTDQLDSGIYLIHAVNNQNEIFVSKFSKK